MGKLTVNRPNRPKGAPVVVMPYGVFKNGSTTEVEALEKDLEVTIAEPPVVEELDDVTRDELLEEAGDAEIKGRHDMTKGELAESLTEHQQETGQPTTQYVSTEEEDS